MQIPTSLQWAAQAGQLQPETRSRSPALHPGESSLLLKPQAPSATLRRQGSHLKFPVVLGGSRFPAPVSTQPGPSLHPFVPMFLSP